MKKYDIIIIGGGPAGTSSAISLKNSGLQVALFEKKAFPREKICGDGLCDRSINVLKDLSEFYFEELMEELSPLPVKKADIVYKRKRFPLSFTSYGYIVPRIDFDQFLMERVKRDCPNVHVYENERINQVFQTNEGVEAFSENHSIKAKLVLFACGAYGSLSGRFSGQLQKNKNIGIAIRAYFQGIKNLEEGRIELHYNKKYFPGYFWIFPLKDGLANVGFGFSRKYALTQQESIRKIFNHWIEIDLKEKFDGAKIVSPIRGGLIPYSQNRSQWAGRNYMITGDAASLADPVFGGGIGNAMLSGRLAAIQAMNCFKIDDFSSAKTKQYNTALKHRLKTETTKRYIFKNALTHHKWIIGLIAFFARKPKLLHRFSNWYLR